MSIIYFNVNQEETQQSKLNYSHWFTAGRLATLQSSNTYGCFFKNNNKKWSYERSPRLIIDLIVVLYVHNHGNVFILMHNLTEPIESITFLLLEE